MAEGGLTMITLYIREPIPTEITWHQLTNWRNLKALKAVYPEIYNKWVAANKIPYHILKEMEED